MIYLALDQSSNITGYSLWRDSELIEYGKVKFEGDFIQRIIDLSDWMKGKIGEIHQENEEVQVILEEIQEQSNMQTFKKLAMVQGALLVELHRLNILTYLVYASSWKSGCGITGKNRSEQKRAAQQYIVRKYDRIVTQDEADAICLGEFVATKIKNWGR